MFSGNTAVVLMVVALVAVMLGAVFAGTYYLNKAVDRSARQ
jgi:predicted Na+-dependent transporter